MNILETLCITDGVIFIYIMIIVIFIIMDANKKDKIKLWPREGFCTCRGAQFNNSAADASQSTCYKDKIPARIWDQSYAGCVSVDDPGKIAYDYEILQKQLPEFSGV